MRKRAGCDVAKSDLSIDRILTETFVSTVDHRDQIESTNDLGLAMVTGGQPILPALVLAEQQTAGRGRGANRWWSAAGALTFSVVFEAASFQIPSQLLPQISLATGLAVCETLRKELPGQRACLKWPNDIYLEGRKVCGILVETSRPSAPFVVVGVGINVNNSLQRAPAELRTIATSLVDVAGRPCDRTSLLIGALQQLELQLRRFRTHRIEFLDRWRELCLLQGRTVCLEVGDRQFIGVCQSIDNEGALLLQCETGIQRFFAGVVRRIL